MIELFKLSMKKGNSLIDVIIAMAVIIIIGSTILYAHDAYTKLLIRRTLIKEGNFIIESVSKELKYNYTKESLLEKFRAPCENIYSNTTLNFDSIKTIPIDNIPRLDASTLNMDNITKISITTQDNITIIIKTILTKNGVKYEKEVTFKKY